MMPSIAFIGPDGAGKTTVTRMIEGSGLLRFRYLYMGINVGSSNRLLPTSRFAEHMKRRFRTRAADEVPATAAGRTGPVQRRPRGRLWAAARLSNWIVEEWYRQGVSWYYQLRGFTVLYDRHFVFDFAPEIALSETEPFDRRVHRWVLRYLYPRPDLVIFLDAPGTVLFARKGELTVAELERRRQAFLRVGARMPGFVRVDATRPLAEVYADAARLVVEFCRDPARGRPGREVV